MESSILDKDEAELSEDYVHYWKNLQRNDSKKWL